MCGKAARWWDGEIRLMRQISCGMEDKWGEYYKLCLEIKGLVCKKGWNEVIEKVFFTSRSVRSVRTAGTKIALRFPRLFVCLFVRPHLSRAQYITSYVTMQLQCTAAFGGLQAKLQQVKVVLCCLDGENVVGSREDCFLAYSY